MIYDKIGLSVYFGYHDSCITFYSDKEILLHLEAERVFRQKHLRVTSDQMLQLIEIGKEYLNIPFNQKFYEFLIAKLGNRFNKDQIKKFTNTPIFTGHHNNHIGTGLVSNYQDSVIVCADGGSEDGTTKIYYKKNDKIELLEDLDNTIMTGKFYGTMTQLIIDPDCWKAHNTNPGRTMGLAALGKHRLEFEKIILENESKLRKSYDTRGCKYLLKLFNLNSNYSSPWLDNDRIDLAFTVQKVWQERFYNKLTEFVHLSENIVFVGGCAYNVPLNSLIADKKLFKNIYVTPVSGDGGQSLGAAIFAHPDLFCNYPFLGRGYNKELDNKIILQVVEDLLNHKIVAWCYGRSEIGARALGNRSFLGLPDSEEMRKKLSINVKKREVYRPVAPVIPIEDLSNFFETTEPSPYMTFAPKAKKITCDRAPAIVHFDGTSRVQTLTKESSLELYKILSLIKEKTGVPILMNSSFNVDGEPIVDTTDDALRNFKSSEADVLYINGDRYTH